jgi:Alkaline and neutral invertase
MAGIAGLMIDDARVADGLVRTLSHLRELQGPEGQIASNYLIEPDGSTRVSFGTLAPRIDSTTWYLIGIALGARAGVVNADAFRDSARSVVRLLDALEYNGRDLIYIPTGGNWADEYIYDGYVLYDQVLRAWALRLLATTYDDGAFATKADRIDAAVRERFWPNADRVRRYPVAAFSPTVTRDIFDLAACSLLAVARIAPDLTSRTLDWIGEQFLSRGALPPAFHPVIAEGDPDWPALRRYHLHGFRNQPHEYHNGGIWPIWLGWLALALAQAERPGELDQLRRVMDTRISRLDHFAFEEYLHGVTGAPGGVASMAYSATGIVFLHRAGSASHTRLFAR